MKTNVIQYFTADIEIFGYVPLIQEGSCQLLANVCARNTGLLPRSSKSAQEKSG